MAARKRKQPVKHTQVPAKQTPVQRRGSLGESSRSSSRTNRDATQDDSVGDASGPRGGA